LAFLQALIPLCEKTLSLSRSERAPEIVAFLLSAIQEERVIFDFEAIFGKLLLEKVVSADSVQLLINIIDVEMEGAGEAEEDSSESDEEGEELEQSFVVPPSPQKSNGLASPPGDVVNNDMEDSVSTLMISCEKMHLTLLYLIVTPPCTDQRQFSFIGRRIPGYGQCECE